MLDTWAMVAYLEAEPAAREVRQALRNAAKGRAVALLCIINFGECLYVMERKHGGREAWRVAGTIDQLPLEIAPADRNLVVAAARLKARHSVSYADAFAAALAKQHDAELMTGDPEFRALEHEIAIHWLPTR
ncbi:MAG TPA: type II toxin-antitoxin system VapC family toxin [Terriglobia bacterium]|nr:type II toxin-antitoxin system VapC family toxin [Terriglobia bacterium]